MSDDKQISKAPDPISPVGGGRPSRRKIHYQSQKAPDWSYWPASRKVWHWQAVALSLNIDPDSMRHSPDGFVSESFPSAEVEAAFKKRLDLLANCLPRPMMSLSKFAEWAASVNLTPIPSELAALANQSPPVVLVNAQLPATEQAKSKAKEGSVEEKSLPNNWKLLIQAEAARMFVAWRNMGCKPNKNAIKGNLAKWCKDENIRTDGHIHPDAEYIYRHVLRNWSPPI